MEYVIKNNGGWEIKVKEQFSMQGLKALYEYLCCEYTEYETAIECAKEYNDFLTEEELKELGEEEAEEEALKYLNENTQVIEFEGGIIIQDF